MLRQLSTEKAGIGLRDLGRVVLVTGKGGVGKTTVAAGLSFLVARAGKRAIFIEFGDNRSGERALKGTPGIEYKIVDSQTAIQEAATELLRSSIIAKVLTGSYAVRQLLRAAPAIRELAQLEYVRTIARNNPDARIIVDMPATGHGLAWLKVPSRMGEILQSGPMYEICERVIGELLSPRTTSVVVVTLPEKLVLQETAELCTSLAREVEIAPSLIIVNRMPAPFSSADLAETKKWARSLKHPSSHPHASPADARLSLAAEQLVEFLDAREDTAVETNEAIDAMKEEIGVHTQTLTLPENAEDPQPSQTATWLEQGVRT